MSSYYVDVSPDRDVLRGKLRTIFSHSAYRCNRLHRFLAQVASGIMIITTNYDTLIEQAFVEAGKPFDLYVYPADNAEYKNALLWWRDGIGEPIKLRPNELDVKEFAGRNVIYKIHGSVQPVSERWDGFVITEEDYIDFLSRLGSRTNTAVPSALKTFFSDRSFLFLGYGLNDWNLRVLLKQLGLRNQSWAILKDPSEIHEKIWAKRNVQIYNLTLEDFVSGIDRVTTQSGDGTGGAAAR